MLVGMIEAIRSRHPRLGGRKLLHLLWPLAKAEGIEIGRDAFFDLLDAHGLKVRKRARSGPRTTDSRAWRGQYPDLLKTRSALDRAPVWVSDITYLPLAQGFVYLALVTDLESRKVLGYQVASSMQTHALSLPALAMALGSVPAYLREGLIHHSDRGSQYLDQAYVRVLAQQGVRVSMSQSGDPRDNAVAERLNGILKQEYLPSCFESLGQAARLVGRAVELYNCERPHYGLGLRTPLESWLQASQRKAPHPEV